MKTFEEWLSDIIGIDNEFKDEFEPVNIELGNMDSLKTLYEQYVEDITNFKPVTYFKEDAKGEHLDSWFEELAQLKDAKRIIKYAPTISADINFRIVHRLGIKPINGEFHFFELDDEAARDIAVSTGITLDEWKIIWANLRLEEMGLEMMTQDEIDNMGSQRSNSPEPEVSQIQRLAGFQSI